MTSTPSCGNASPSSNANWAHERARGRTTYAEVFEAAALDSEAPDPSPGPDPVSYTHLTLPTIYSV